MISSKLSCAIAEGIAPLSAMPKVSSRRATALKDSDYDHEITIEDHAAESGAQSPGSREDPGAGPSSRPSTTDPLVLGDSPSSPAPVPPQQGDDAAHARAASGPVSPGAGAPTVTVQGV